MYILHCLDIVIGKESRYLVETTLSQSLKKCKQCKMRD